jgi:hypothetical protein
MRHDEELCRQALSSLLKQRGLDDHWTEGDEPPDWFLNTAGGRFAVEVTSIHGFTNLGTKDFTWTQLSGELLSFGAEVCSEVEARVNLSGSFLVSFPSIPNLKSWKSAIVQALVEYLKTHGSAAAPMMQSVALRPEGREIAVWKVKEGGSILVAQALPTGAFITHRDGQLEGLLASVMQKKVHKLKDVTEPVILVILDQYGFQRSIEEWRACVPYETSYFEAVVRVQGKNAELVAGTLPAS